MTRERVLVTGGAGFIGSHVVEALLSKGYDPYVLDDLSSGTVQNLPPGVPVYVADIADRQAVADVIAKVQPSHVCHLAAQISVSHSVRDPARDAGINIIGWLHVLKESANSGVKRVVYASSGGTLYGNVTQPAGEDAPIRPISPYGISKLAGEHYLRFFVAEHGLEGVALRFANVYGPRQDPNGEAGVVAIFTSRMLDGAACTIFGDGQNVRDYVHVRDVARSVVLALAATGLPKFTAVNIGTGLATDVNQLQQKLRHIIEGVLKREGAAALLQPPQYGPAREGDLRSSLLSPTLANAVLGWAPQVSVEIGLRETVQWFAARTRAEQAVNDVAATRAPA